jgi:hypothetical protein
MVFITFIAISIAFMLGALLRADAEPISARVRERRYMP